MKEQQSEKVVLLQGHHRTNDRHKQPWYKLCLGCSVGPHNSSFTMPFLGASNVEASTNISNARIHPTGQKQQQAHEQYDMPASGLSLQLAPGSVVMRESSNYSPNMLYWRPCVDSCEVSQIASRDDHPRFTASFVSNESFQVTASGATYDFESRHPSIIAAEKAADAGWRDFMAWRMLWRKTAMLNKFHYHEADLEKHELDLIQRLQGFSHTTYGGSVHICPSSSVSIFATDSDDLSTPSIFKDADSTDWEAFVEAPEWDHAAALTPRQMGFSFQHRRCSILADTMNTVHC